MDDLKSDPHHTDEPALDYWEEQRDKLQTLSLKLLFLRPKLAGTGGVATAEDIDATNPKGKLITVNDWAKAKGLALSISQATEVGMRAAKMYEAKYGMPPSQVTSRRSPLFTGNFVSDMRRPWKGERGASVPTDLLNRVGVYPKPIIERAWRMQHLLKRLDEVGQGSIWKSPRVSEVGGLHGSKPAQNLSQLAACVSFGVKAKRTRQTGQHIALTAHQKETTWTLQRA